MLAPATAVGRFCEHVAANLFANANCAADDVSEFYWFAMDALPDTERIAFEHEKAVMKDLYAWIASGAMLKSEKQF